MKIPLTYGLGLALASAIMTLLMHVTGLTTNPDKLLLAAAVGFPLGLALALTAIILGTRKARAEQPPGSGFSYGQAFKTGFLIVIVSGIAGAVFNTIYYTLLFPDFAEVSIEASRAMMEKIGAREVDIERVAEDMRAKSTVTRQVVGALIGGVIFGTIITLITSAVMKRRPADIPLTAPPPVP